MEWISPDKIILNPDNPRTIKDDKFRKLVKSIQNFPRMLELRPIIVNEHGMILGGNMRREACVAAGLKEVPVVKAKDLTPEQQREFIIKDNLGYGEWDWDSIANNWDAEQVTEWGLDIPDFKSNKDEIEEDDYEFADSIQTDIMPGDCFVIGKHRLLCGDSTDTDSTDKLMEGIKADLVFTDPDFSMPWDQLKAAYSNALIHSHGFSFWVCGDKQAVQLAANDIERFSHFYVHDFRIPNLISNGRSMQRHTLIAKFGTKPINNLHDGFSTLIEVATDRATRKEMPMAKKIELPAVFMLHYSKEGETVLDLFGHSGSTMMAAEQTGRICFTQELEPKFCHAMIDRFIKKYPDTEIKRNGEKYLHK